MSERNKTEETKPNPAIGSRVFITQWARTRDFSDAVRFGALLFFTTVEVWPDSWENEVITARVDIENIIQRFNFHPEKDYLLLTGDPVIMAMVCAVIGARWPKAPLKLLKYDKMLGGYVPIQVLGEHSHDLRPKIGNGG